MGTISLQIDGKYAFLEPDVSISIEEQSPVWGEGNSFSFPFELDVEANRHIIGNADQLTGGSIYQALEGKSAVIYAMGIPIFYGEVSLDDEVDTEEGHIEITVVSSRMSFDEMIEGMNCQDVELSEEIILGEKWSTYNVQVLWQNEPVDVVRGYMPGNFMRMRNNGVSTYNVSDPYPTAKYCNVRICYPLPEELADEEKGPEKELENIVINVDNLYLQKGYKSNIETLFSGKYVVLDADRALSAPCFYVMYFLECLFGKLSIQFNSGRVAYEEDLNRLAFFSTACKFTEKDTGQTESFPVANKEYKIKQLVDYSWTYPSAYFKNISSDGSVHAKGWFDIVQCIASSENFPKEDCSTIIESIEKAFGIRFLFDKKMSQVTPVFVRDILRNISVKEIHAIVTESHKRENSVQGFVLKYSGNEEDTAYNYEDYTNTQNIEGYNNLQLSVTAFDKTCYIDPRNMNAYRIKNDGDAQEFDTQNPALFEVGMFNQVKYGNFSNEKRVEKVEIPFSPVVMNDVETPVRLDKLKNDKKKGQLNDNNNNEQEFAVLLDVQMRYPSAVKEQIIIGSSSYGAKPVDFKIAWTYVDVQGFDEKLSKPTHESDAKYPDRWWAKTGAPMLLKYLDNDSPIQTFDAGLTLGIMRGPGNTAGIQDYDENYDGEGNSKYVTVPSNYAFHSDSVDNYGRVFDYNGTNDDGVSDHFSLKLRAEKPVLDSDGNPLQCSIPEAQRRGLFDRFYTEYAYFVTHRKIAVLSLRMELADLVNIDWTVRYRFGDYVGFVNKVNYTVSADGVSDVTVEMFYL